MTKPIFLNTNFSLIGFYPEGSMGHCTNIRFNSCKQRVEFINDNWLIDEFANKEILWKNFKFSQNDWTGIWRYKHLTIQKVTIK
jgi:hypothetical protein